MIRGAFVGFGLAVAAAALVAAWGLTSSLSLPGPAVAGIWVIAGLYALVYALFAWYCATRLMLPQEAHRLGVRSEDVRVTCHGGTFRGRWVAWVPREDGSKRVLAEFAGHRVHAAARWRSGLRKLEAGAGAQPRSARRQA